MHFKKTNRKFIIVSILIMSAILTASALIFSSFFISTKLTSGVFIDGIDVSGLTKNQAENLLKENDSKIIENLYIILKHGNYSWEIPIENLNVCYDYKEALETASSARNEGTLFEKISQKKQINKEGLYLYSKTIFNERNLNTTLEEIEAVINFEMVKASIAFDPSEYNYFDESQNSQSMFQINPGSSGYKADTEKKTCYRSFGKKR